jgi:hypothetical protein
MKAAVRVTRVIHKIHISRDFSRAMFKDTDVSPRLVDSVLVSQIDQGDFL